MNTLPVCQWHTRVFAFYRAISKSWEDIASGDVFRCPHCTDITQNNVYVAVRTNLLHLAEQTLIHEIADDDWPAFLERVSAQTPLLDAAMDADDVVLFTNLVKSIRYPEIDAVALPDLEVTL